MHVVGFSIEKRVEPYLYSLSGPLWPVLGWTIPLLFTVLLAKEETVLQNMVARLIEIGRCCRVEMNVSGLRQ